jgi:hypothetical protein
MMVSVENGPLRLEQRKDYSANQHNGGTHQHRTDYPPSPW